jgi:hypothetical protein
MTHTRQRRAGAGTIGSSVVAVVVVIGLVVVAVAAAAVALRKDATRQVPISRHPAVPEVVHAPIVRLRPRWTRRLWSATALGWLIVVLGLVTAVLVAALLVGVSALLDRAL